jgi:hypothetical protein
VAHLANGGPKRIELFDLTLPEFGMRFGVSGSKSRICFTRHHGRARLCTVDSCPRISPREAREFARGVMKETKINADYQPACNSPTLLAAIQ